MRVLLFLLVVLVPCSARAALPSGWPSRLHADLWWYTGTPPSQADQFRGHVTFVWDEARSEYIWYMNGGVHAIGLKVIPGGYVTCNQWAVSGWSSLAYKQMTWPGVASGRWEGVEWTIGTMMVFSIYAQELPGGGSDQGPIAVSGSSGGGGTVGGDYGSDFFTLRWLATTATLGVGVCGGLILWRLMILSKNQRHFW